MITACHYTTVEKLNKAVYIARGEKLVAARNPILWRGVLQKSTKIHRLKIKEKWSIHCIFCNYRFIGYFTICYGNFCIVPPRVNMENLHFFVPRVASATRFVVVRPCSLSRDFFSGPKGNLKVYFQLLGAKILVVGQESGRNIMSPSSSQEKQKTMCYHDRIQVLNLKDYEVSSVMPCNIKYVKQNQLIKMVLSLLRNTNHKIL